MKIRLLALFVICLPMTLAGNRSVHDGRRQDVDRTGARGAGLCRRRADGDLGPPFVDNVHTLFAGLKAGAVGLNYYRKFPNLKTAADKFVNTPNNVSIDGYGCADLSVEPVVVSVPTIKEHRWTIVQIGDYYDQVVYNIGGSKGAEPGLFLLTGRTITVQSPPA